MKRMNKHVIVFTVALMLLATLAHPNMLVKAQDATPFTEFELPLPTGFMIWSMTFGLDNCIYIVLQESIAHSMLARFNTTDRTFTVLYENTTMTYSLLFNGCVDADGNIWVHGRMKLLKLNPETDEITEYPIPNGGIDVKFYNGYIWCLTTDEIHKITTDGVIEQSYYLGEHSDPRNIIIDGEYFWITFYVIYTQGKLVKFNPNDGTFEEKATDIPYPYWLGKIGDSIYVASFLDINDQAIITRYDILSGLTEDIVISSQAYAIRAMCTTKDKVWWTVYGIYSDYVGYIDLANSVIGSSYKLMKYQVDPASDPESLSEGLGFVWVDGKNLTLVDEGYYNVSHGSTTKFTIQEDTPENESLSVIDDSNGDINSDGNADIFDIVTVAIAFGSSYGQPSYKLMADRNIDNVVDIFDIVYVATHFGGTG